MPTYARLTSDDMPPPFERMCFTWAGTQSLDPWITAPPVHRPTVALEKNGSHKMRESSIPDVPVTVAILTFRRQHLLPPLLEEVARQREGLPARVDIVVVDNDPERSAEPTVKALTTKFPIRYVSEPTPGIAAARDTAVRSARNSRLLVFIDDDEMPLPGWLGHLLRHWGKSRSAAVAGPVEYILPTPIPDPRVIASGVFDRVRRPTGSRQEGASSANLLLDLNFLKEQRLSFDRSLGLRGGEDTMLTHQITAAGGIIEWCDEAAVSEAVSPDRVTRRWLRRRSFRSGASWGRAKIVTAPGRRAQLGRRMAIVAKSSTRIAMGIAAIAYGLIFRDATTVARQARTVYSHAGALSSVVGAPQVEDYSRN